LSSVCTRVSLPPIFSVLDHSVVVANLREEFEGAVLFVDISGFTMLTNRLSGMSEAGIEDVTRHINTYFSAIIDEVYSHGGDVLKFAGDALVCMFASLPSTRPAGDAAGLPLKAYVHAAMKTAEHIQHHHGTYEAPGGVTLSLHIGISAGRLDSLFVGELDRWEWLVTGDALTELDGAVEASESGEIVVTPSAWELVKDVARGTEVGGGVKLSKVVADLDSEVELRMLTDVAIDKSSVKLHEAHDHNHGHGGGAHHGHGHHEAQDHARHHSPGKAEKDGTDAGVGQAAAAVHAQATVAMDKLRSKLNKLPPFFALLKDDPLESAPKNETVISAVGAFQQSSKPNSATLESCLNCHIVPAVKKYVESNAGTPRPAELRRITVLFVKLGNNLQMRGDTSQERLRVLSTKINEVFVTMQRILYDLGGVVRQFLVDDKVHFVVRSPT
jgi:class 3 adenylate cyclase